MTTTDDATATDPAGEATLRLVKAPRRTGNGPHGMNWCRQDLRLAVYLRDGLACVYCDSGLEDDVRFTLDHVIPRSEGGRNAASNLVTCCQRCNSIRGTRPVEEFAKYVEGMRHGAVTADDLTRFIIYQLSTPIGPFRESAKALIRRRGSAARAVAAMGSKSVA